MRIVSGLLPGHVLQRTPKGASVTIGGIADAAGAVIATIASGKKPLKGWAAKALGTVKAGEFRLTLKGIPTGGPYTVTLLQGKGKTQAKAVVPEVFVGDLWLMAGQSNMEGVGNLSDAPKPHPLVRNFDMDHRWSIARDPLHHLPESPDVVHNNGVQQPLEQREKAKRARIKGAGVGVFFGIEMHRRTGVPQGLIATAHGGTSMEQWDPAKKDQGGASLYGSMLSSLRDVGQPVAGVLWYQGCSETHPAAAKVYSERMPALVAAVRADLGQPALPWITVQIGRLVAGARGGEKEWNSIQEQQRLLPRLIRNLDTVVAVDLGLDDLIHISTVGYATLGQRMARAAARLVHGDKKEIPAIQFAKFSEHRGSPFGPRLEVTFANVVGGLRSPGLPLGFTLVDGDQQPVDLIYKTELVDNRAILHLTGLDQPDLSLMYGWGKNPACTVVDGRGMAVPVFGPVPLAPGLVSGWLKTWDVSAVRPGEDIGAMVQPTRDAFGALEHRSWGTNFVNNHDLWQTTSGHVAFFGAITLSEPMELELRTGYDGPFRLWLGGTEVVKDLKGTNPALADKVRKKLSLPAGTHPITVLMALNGGRAWGFFLRFARRKVSAKQAKTKVALPVPMA